MNDQMMRPPPLPYQMWAAPVQQHQQFPPAWFARGKPARPARPARKRLARPGWKRKAAAGGAARLGGSAAPRNTTSYLIRAKRTGGVASLVSPCPVTPAVLPTPLLSPVREVLGDMAKEAWGVDGYGSMKGLIRLRSQAADAGEGAADEDSGSGQSDVEEHDEMERRLDHDLSRFEMVQLPGPAGFQEAQDDDDESDEETRTTRLEEENLTLRARLFHLERDMADIRHRLLAVETLCRDRHRDGCVVDAAAEEDATSPTVVDLAGAANKQ